ncbi:hypothetical protein BJX66DRAFT_334202 [Aspergillus keveii]|uniref:Uncharacterized protein n=1 Tax=Aspergillus keveii TaxID=714993 RepID=A0ABR4GGI2_9EURO
MAKRIRKAKRGAQAAHVEGKLPTKGKATKPLENSTPNVKKRLTRKRHKTASHLISLKDLDLATSDAQTNKATALSEDDPESIIKYVNERHWNVGDSSSAEFVAPTVSEGKNVNLNMIEWGHEATQDGGLEAAYLVFQVDGLRYWIVIDNPYNDHDQKRNIAHQCMDCYLRNRQANLVELITPISMPFLRKNLSPSPPHGYPGTYPEFEHIPCIDWAEYVKLWPSVKMWSLADVKRFALHSTTSSIYEVTIDRQSEPLV